GFLPDAVDVDSEVLPQARKPAEHRHRTHPESFAGVCDYRSTLEAAFGHDRAEASERHLVEPAADVGEAVGILARPESSALRHDHALGEEKMRPRQPRHVVEVSAVRALPERAEPNDQQPAWLDPVEDPFRK